MLRFRFARAFTILEMMIAVTIFALIIIAVYSTWTAVLRGSKAGLDAAAEVQRSRIAMRCIQDALLTAQFFAENHRYYSFVADTSGDYAELSLVSRLPASFPGVGRYGDDIVRRVSFSVRQNTNSQMELVMSQAPLLMATNENFESYSLPLIQGVNLFALEFWDEQESDWATEWLKTNQLPRMVRVALGLGKSGQGSSSRGNVTTRVVSLPATAVPQIPGMAPTGVPTVPGQPPTTPAGGQPPGQR